MRKMFFKNQYKLNAEMVANMHRQYVALIAEGHPIATPKRITTSGVPGKKYSSIIWVPETYKMARLISERTNIDKMMVYFFLTALFDLARKGDIVRKKYDPIGVQQTTQLQQTITGKPWYEQAGQFATGTAKMIPLLLIGGSVLGLLYLTKGAKSGNN